MTDWLDETDKPSSWKIMKLEQFAAFHWDLLSFVEIAKHVCKGFRDFDEAYPDATFRKIFNIANNKLDEHSPIESKLSGPARSAVDADNAAICWFYNWARGEDSSSPSRIETNKSQVDEHTLDPRLNSWPPPPNVSKSGYFTGARTADRVPRTNQPSTMEEPGSVLQPANTGTPSSSTAAIADWLTGEKRSDTAVYSDTMEKQTLENASRKADVGTSHQADGGIEQPGALSYFETIAPEVLTLQKDVDMRKEKQEVFEEPRCSLCGASRWGVHQHTRECPERLFFDRR